MARTIEEKVRDWKWWGEQVAHMLVGAAVSGTTSTLSLVLPGDEAWIHLIAMFAGSSTGAIYEIVQNFGDDPASNDTVDSNVDAWAFTIGAFLAAVVWVVAG